MNCLGCGNKLIDHNVRLLICEHGCCNWFHNYPAKCMRIWIKDQMGVSHVHQKLESGIVELDKLGLNNVTRKLKCPNEGCIANINRAEGTMYMSFNLDRYADYWDKVDFTSQKLFTNYLETVKPYQTGLIGKLVDQIWETMQGQSKYKRHTMLKWDVEDSNKFVKEEFKKAVQEAREFDKKIRQLMPPEIYSPDKYSLPYFIWNV